MTAALIVFVLGLRHGADPDHLAAIDNLTRNVYDRMPRASRLVGALFAMGHSAMVLAMAAAAAMLGSTFLRPNAMLEKAVGIASVVVLLMLASLNIATIRRGTTTPRMRLLPAGLRTATNPLAAVVVGAVFGVGFETSSQLVAYGAAFSSAHLSAGLLLGAAFCLGMICTDTFDSMFVSRLVSTRTKDEARTRNAWIVVVTVVAFAVAAEKLVELLGYRAPFDELVLSAITVAVLATTALTLSLRRTASS